MARGPRPPNPTAVSPWHSLAPPPRLLSTTPANLAPRPLLADLIRPCRVWGSWIKGAQAGASAHSDSGQQDSGQQPPASTTMAKEWGYASHNGESPAGRGALHWADLRPRAAPENWGGGVGWGHHPAPALPLCLHLTALPRSWCHTPCGSGAGSLPKATLPRCLRGARPCRSSSEWPRPGVRHSPLSPGRRRVGSAHTCGQPFSPTRVHCTKQLRGWALERGQEAQSPGAGGAWVPSCGHPVSRHAGFLTRRRVLTGPRVNNPPPPPAQVLTTGMSFTQSPRETTSHPSSCTRRTLSTTHPCSRGRPPTTPPPARAS